ncbi:MAG: hypothetical protein IKF78_09155 [Atopobiaceae bacterium]|nr:hypothetical protein [Atopobiaceae bacterium]
MDTDYEESVGTLAEDCEVLLEQPAITVPANNVVPIRRKLLLLMSAFDVCGIVGPFS